MRKLGKAENKDQPRNWEYRPWQGSSYRNTIVNEICVQTASRLCLKLITRKDSGFTP